MKYLYLDLETTGLDRGIDQITECAALTSHGEMLHAYVKHDRLPCEWVLDRTDYVQRILGAEKTSVESVLLRIKYLCDDETYLVGANPAFDHAFLEREYRSRGWVVPYRFRLIDIEAMVMACYGLSAPPALKDCRAILGLAGQNDAPHTAMADANEVRVVFEALQAERRAA